VAAAAALALADASIVTLALPELLTELDATVEGVAAVIGVYTIVVAAALLPAERLRRAVGSRALGLASLALFAAACAACAAVSSLEALLVLRAIQALGGAGALIAAFGLLDAGHSGSRGRVLWTRAAVLGVAAGPALGGVLTQVFDWRAIFAAQVPVAVAAAVACARTRDTPDAAPTPGAAPPQLGPLVALGLVSAGLTAVLFMLVLLLVAGWNLSPLAAAAAVSVLPLAALAAGRAEQPRDPRARAATGCLLVGAGTIALAFLPTASAWWTIVPQLLAGAGMGLALPALAGELIPERDPREAGLLLAARHAGIAVALVALAPIVSSDLESATERARERGVALVLDSSLPPTSKIELAPELLSGVSADQPRRELSDAIERNRDRFDEEDERAAYERLAERADDTLVQAVDESFRAAFLIAAAFGLGAALFVLPARPRRAALLRMGGVALAVPLVYAALDAAVGVEPVDIANPCLERELPEASGLPGVVQDEALVQLDRIACHFGSSREELVLALANARDAREYERRYGANPRSPADLGQGLLGP
jgi:MFS family permease